VDDDDKGITDEEWRERWVAGGSKWHSRGIAAPQAWSAKKQMAALVGDKSKPAKIVKTSPLNRAKKARKAAKPVPKKKAAVKKKSAAAKKKPPAGKKQGKGTKR
jgi:hypothetical protein